MLDKSLFISQEVHAYPVRLSDGSEHPMFFREASAVDFRKFVFAERSGDEDRQAASIAHLIAACVCDADGKPAMTHKQAGRLKPDAANAIFTVILAMNKAGDAEGNGSRPGEKTGSGTSSPSPSAAEQ